jgi:hypothetical protein
MIFITAQVTYRFVIHTRQRLGIGSGLLLEFDIVDMVNCILVDVRRDGR